MLRFTPACLLLSLVAGCGPRQPIFLWGSATAAYQVESGNHHSDWKQWEELGRIQDGGQADLGPQMDTHFEQDLATAAALGHTAYRLGLEWSRLEPQEGALNADAVAYYHAVLDACLRHGLTPMVTLSHFTLPTWLHDVKDRQRALLGWADGGKKPGDGRVVPAFARFASEMGRTYGGKVDLWVPLNEPLVQVIATYLNPNGQESFPHPPLLPGEGFPRLTTAVHAATNFLYAHAAAYDALHEADTLDADRDGVPAQVGIAQHMRHLFPAADQNDYRVAAKNAEYVVNFLLVDALTRGDLDVTLDEKYDAPGEGRALPELAGRLDFLGINYYSRSEVLPITVNAKQPYSDALFSLKMVAGETTRTNLPKTDLGWDVWPDGLHHVVMRAHERYRLPIYITENGLADASDSRRPSFIWQHVKALERARADGAEVRGYLFWSLVDNFEWVRGFGPRFGLLKVDYEKPDRPRSVTRGAQAYAELIQEGRVTEELERRYPAP